jgi:hypothetical protein
MYGKILNPAGKTGKKCMEKAGYKLFLRDFVLIRRPVLSKKF